MALEEDDVSLPLPEGTSSFCGHSIDSRRHKSKPNKTTLNSPKCYESSTIVRCSKIVSTPSIYLATLLMLTRFPPGPPPSQFFYDIPFTPLILELNTLGVIRNRDETIVQHVLDEAFRASLDRPPNVGLSQAGYQLQEGTFLLGVAPSRTLPGEQRLKWQMWTETLTGLFGYTRAYPGYDFTFEIWLFPEDGSVKSYVIGAGFAISRMRGGEEA